MTKKIIKAVIFVLILALPSIAAVGFYCKIRQTPITNSSVSEMKISGPDGSDLQYQYNVKDKNSTDKEVSQKFVSMLLDAQEVDLNIDLSSHFCYDVSLVSYNRNYSYKYYLCSDAEKCFIRSGEGKLFNIAEEDMAAFLVTKDAAVLFPSSVPPTLTVAGSTELLPDTMSWKFKGYKSKFFEAEASVSELVTGFDVSGGLQVSFDNEPDYLSVVLSDVNGMTVYNGAFDQLDASLFSSNNKYDVRLTAKWFEDAERDYFGEGLYHFEANVLSPAVFYVNTDTIEYGDYVVISAKNIVNTDQITFRSEPDIGFTPQFYFTNSKDNTYCHALVPVPITMAGKNAPEQITLTVGYGDVIQEIPLNLSVRKSTTVYQDFSLEQINLYRTEQTIEDFNMNLADAFSNQLNTIYWLSDIEKGGNIVATPPDNYIKNGYGVTVYLNKSKTTYIHEGVNFSVSKMDTVNAAMDGVVVFAGETRLSGLTIVLDHGGGLKTLYAHLSSVGVTKGELVSKGTTIGIVGSTGFTKNVTLHFGMYIQNIPVRPYDASVNGIRVADAVAKQLGINYPPIITDDDE